MKPTDTKLLGVGGAVVCLTRTPKLGVAPKASFEQPLYDQHVSFMAVTPRTTFRRRVVLHTLAGIIVIVPPKWLARDTMMRRPMLCVLA